MKTTIISILLCLSMGKVIGQFKVINKENTSVYDTVSIIMLVNNTKTGPITFAMNGYAAIVKYWLCCNPNNNQNASYYWYIESTKYLDEKKKPLPKNIVVWQTK